MENPIRQTYSYRTEDYPEDENPWEWWNSFRVICDYNKKLGVSLIVSHDLPEEEEVAYKLNLQIKIVQYECNM